MESSFALLGLAIALFASTNVDDLFVLVGFFADPKVRARDIVIGQYAGITVLFVVSVVASLLSLVIPRS
jgi:cadmium resistance protein CadD (predicted permease)